MPPIEISVPEVVGVEAEVSAVEAPRTATRSSRSTLTSVRNVPCQTS